MSSKATPPPQHQQQHESMPTSDTDSAWQVLAEIDEELAAAAEEQAARAEALERLALEHARCEDAASACYYLCRSLGAARQLEPSEPGLELLFELLGALADLPLSAEASASPESPAETGTEIQGEADGLGVFELCQQLQAARDQSRRAWCEMAEPEAGEADAADAVVAPTTAPASRLIH